MLGNFMPIVMVDMNMDITQSYSNNLAVLYYRVVIYIKDYEKAIHYYKKAGIKIEDCGNDPRGTRELVVQCPYLTFLNVHHLERQGAYIQTKVEELEQLNQSIRDRDKMKDDAIAHLSDQLIDLTTRLDSIERRQR